MELSDERSEIRAWQAVKEGREHSIAAYCLVETHTMEPRAARSRKGEGPRGEQERRRSRGGEAPSGGAESSGGIGGGDALLQGRILLSWEDKGGSPCLCPSLPSREREVKGIFGARGPCLVLQTLSPQRVNGVASQSRVLSGCWERDQAAGPDQWPHPLQK